MVCVSLTAWSHAQADVANSKLIRGSEFKSAIHVSGTQTLHGTKQPYAFHMESDFRFRTEATGDLPEVDGFDGKDSWHLNGSGVPHISSNSDRDLARMLAYVQAGVWACKNSPIEIVSENGNDLVIKCKDGKTTAKLTLDSTTKTAKILATWGSSGTESWTFNKYQNHGGLLIPTEIHHVSGETDDTISITRFNQPIAGEFGYGMPPASTQGFTFDPKATSEIEVKRMFGYLFVKPKLDGQDEGWWFLDTGAEIMVIDPQIARNHNMKVVGKDSVPGVVASVTTNFSKGVEFNLGPVTIKNSSFMELDMKPFADALGIKLAGIIGYDFISRVSLDIDPKKRTIGVFPTGFNQLPHGMAWTPFVFHGNIPSLNCEYEGGRFGQFCLDTGSGSTVDFFTPAVEQNGLLKDRKVTGEMTGGAGGASESKRGEIGYFIFGPKRFDKPKVGFQITKIGGFASPFVDGNIGMGFMSKFRMIVDYQKSRLSLLESY